MSRTLQDPTLTLAYPLGDDDYVDVDGKHIDVEHNVPGRSLTRVQRRGRLVAIMSHDAALDEQPQVTAATVSATGLAIENARLYATMQDSLDKIRTSRLRLAQTAFDERQRIQRDLHDYGQHRFVKVLVSLSEASRQHANSGVDMPDVAATIRCAHAELTDAIRALRELGMGIYPAVLLDHGLATAVENLVDRAPLPVNATVRTADGPST